MLPGAYLPTFAGGTLAHLIHYHGETLIDWIEREAWRDVDFLTALSNAWVAREGVDPNVLSRLRVATGARIQIVRQPERDAAYKAMFERWITGRPQRAGRQRTKRSDLWPLGGETDHDEVARLARSVGRSLTPLDIPKETLRGLPLSLRFNILLLRFHSGMARRSRLTQHMAQGATVVWVQWFFLTAVRARLVLPTLVVALCIISASPGTDLVWVALAFVLATVGAAVAGVAIGVVSERRREFPYALWYVGVMTLTPYATLLGLIARAEHGVIVAPAVVTGLVARPYVWRFFRRARAALRHDK